ncbi:alpha/beta-hydrolase [Anaeromyces robustus]|uniref:Alpha/beta-hydrolase n=1 Tax=Anaeromyces robustus TaxID=1754192 RepID=A0A1Y1WNU2_9FUNG|nr:alpha/beta-hydrolase [Anaeromyces robustus]|eukprot:ORX75055.1 alpha/beta-hydrolase [Anaeromyces robustus]
MTSKLLYDLFYYKTLITSFIAPKSSAAKALELYTTAPPSKKEPEWEIEFEKNVPYQILKVPFDKHIKEIEKRKEIEKSTPYEIVLIPSFPKELTVLEYLPNPNVPKREETIICVHGWGGRSLNFFKFIPKLQDKGFRVLAPDFPQHGKTDGPETGGHVFGHSINNLIRYVNGPVYLITHSLGNVAFCINYAISTEEERKLIKRYVGIAIPNEYNDIMVAFENLIGLSNRSHPYFVEENIKWLGEDFTKNMVFGEIVKNYNIPTLLIHDKNDKELDFDKALQTASLLPYKTYKINNNNNNNNNNNSNNNDNNSKPTFFISEGLGHRRIIRDDGIVDRVVEFLSEDIELQN